MSPFPSVVARTVMNPLAEPNDAFQLTSSGARAQTTSHHLSYACSDDFSLEGSKMILEL